MLTASELNRALKEIEHAPRPPVGKCRECLLLAKDIKQESYRHLGLAYAGMMDAELDKARTHTRAVLQHIEMLEKIHAKAKELLKKAPRPRASFALLSQRETSDSSLPIQTPLSGIPAGQ